MKKVNKGILDNDMVISTENVQKMGEVTSRWKSWWDKARRYLNLLTQAKTEEDFNEILNNAKESK